MRHASGHNYRNSSFIVDVAMGQIPCSTERISSWLYNVCRAWTLDIIYCICVFVFGASQVEPCWRLRVDSRQPGQLGHRAGSRPWQQAREDVLRVTGHSEWRLLCLVVNEYWRLVRILYIALVNITLVHRRRLISETCVVTDWRILEPRAFGGNH